jgi:hypothetical protein
MDSFSKEKRLFVGRIDCPSEIGRRERSETSSKLNVERKYDPVKLIENTVSIRSQGLTPKNQNGIACDKAVFTSELSLIVPIAPQLAIFITEIFDVFQGFSRLSIFEANKLTTSLSPFEINPLVF